MANEQYDPQPSFWKSPAGWAFLVAAAVGGFYLFTEHQAHLFGFLPYLVLAACPLMHLFMHHGHHHGSHHHDQQAGKSSGDSHDPSKQ